MSRTTINPATPLLALAASVAVAGCVHVKVDPLEVKPIEINATVTLKVDRELDDIFGFDKRPATPAATTQGAAQVSSAAADHH